ncbi:MAG: family 20 glycosylhydrolase [Bacteroidota bacterium]
MKTASSFIILISVFFMVSCSNNMQKSAIPEIEIIPAPVNLITGEGSFAVNENTVLLLNNDDQALKNLVGFLSKAIYNVKGFSPKIKVNNAFDNKSNYIGFKLVADDKLNGEAYTLNADGEKVIIQASKPAGLFYGLQTLLQLMPAELYGDEKSANIDIVIPAVQIKDEPRFSYRGMHLDVSRHFFPKEFIKKYIDLIAFNKMNVFHWHLVDDQGWRVEIKKYPKLTDIGAWRVDREDKIWFKREAQKPDEKATYGGFYSQEDIREIVAYAKDRYVTIIPEIELPAHVMSAIAAYPQLSCTNESITVPPGSVWPITNIYCAGKDSTFLFLEDVLTEVMNLFPSEYIHIGGDEATKTNWEKCKHCQKRIKTEGLGNVEELQSYFIKRIEKFLVSKGRKLIGWDEILEGGLAPEATVMSWRGIRGGIAAVKSGHDAVMTPNSYCYFDHYQGDKKIEPVAIGGYTTLKKVYSYEPIPDELTEQEAKHILGAQANVWTEYIYDGKQVEYMSVPRMSALAEVVWSPKEKKDWDNFNRRMQKQFIRYKYMDVNYSKGTTKVDINPLFSGDSILVEFYNERYNPEIHYTLDGNAPTVESPVYSSPITISETLTLKAVLVDKGKIIGNPSEKLIAQHKAMGAKVVYAELYDEKYKAKAELNLTDGMTGTDSHNDGYWQGFDGYDMEVVLDFGKSLDFAKLSVGCYQNQKSWIFLPNSVEFSISDDGENFISIGVIKNNVPAEEKGIIIKRFKLETELQKANYLKVKVKALKTCPEWHSGAGEKSWLFVDEITVD